MADLVIKNLDVFAEDKKIIDSLSLVVRPGEVVALMGPNGSGKSTLSHALVGNKKFSSKGTITYNGKNIINASTDERARMGIFLAFQSPLAISGVPVFQFLRTAYNSVYPSKTLSVLDFKELMLKKLKEVGLKPEYLTRSLNEGFSGGETKRLELLQLLILKPKIAILDEIDSGLDADGLKLLASAINLEVKNGMGVLIITHYTKLLDLLNPNAIHILHSGKITKSGDVNLAKSIEKVGYHVG